jgi:membrane protein
MRFKWPPKIKLPAKVSWIPMLVWGAINGLIGRNGIEISGYIAFTIMLAFFPFMIFLVAVAGFFGDSDSGARFIDTLALLAPPQVATTLEPVIQEVLKNRSGGLLTIGLAGALYSAGSGVAALRLALNLSYGVDETRSYFMRKLEDFLLVIIGSVVVLLSSVAIILGPWIWGVATWLSLVDAQQQEFWHILRYGVTLIMMQTAVMALHRVLPDSHLTWRQIFPGALTTTISWIVAASLLTVYFGHFADYAATYGSLGGVVITLMFFYISAIIFVFGGELNAALIARGMTLSHTPNSELKSSSTKPSSLRPA